MDLTLASLITLGAATLRLATPILFAAIGEMITERAGILNLGIEGTMVLGAATGFLASYLSGSLLVGLSVALLSGLIAGGIMSLFSVWLGANQHVSGLGITILGTGMGLYLSRLWFSNRSEPPSIEAFRKLELHDALGVWTPLFEQYLLTYLALISVGLMWWFLYRTHWGLNIRAVGENPEAADISGVNVYWIRTLAVVVGSGFMAVGGAYLSIAQLGSFTPGMVAGRGWVAIALVIFGHWRPVPILLGALLFGGFDAVQLRLQTLGIDIPYQALLALPYLVTILVLVIAGRHADYPSALLEPYRREES